MDTTRQQPQLVMQRVSLDGLPTVELPAGYALRHYHTDAAAWEEIIAPSFQAAPGSFAFAKIMRGDFAFRPERIWFITCDDRPVATASAFYQPLMIPQSGMLHYVGVLPAHAGRKLGAMVSLAALHQMAREGRQGAWLSTDDFRLPAIKTYLNLGFAPLPVHENQRERWQEILSARGFDQYAERFQEVLAEPIFTPPDWPRDDFDYSPIPRRRRHHAGRPSGRPSRGEVDSFADESLYSAASLGWARVEPASVQAGSYQGFSLFLTIGAAGLAAGTTVSFYTPGQDPLGTQPQSAAADRPGYCRLHGPDHAVLEIAPRGIAFTIVAGMLQDGDEVRLDIGLPTSFRWTPLAGRKEFKVIFSSSGEPDRRLPEPVVMSVQPDVAARVEALLPATALPGARVSAQVTVRDRYDNPVQRNGEVSVRRADELVTVPLVAGRSRAEFRISDTPLRIHAGIADLPESASNPCVPATDLQLFIGDLHVHDFTCPAEGYTKNVYAWARDEKRLDFISVAVQNHAYLDNDKWQVNKHMAECFLEEGRFVTFPAFEWQHAHYGDKVVHYLGGDQPYLPVDDARYAHPARLYEALRGSDALIISHHPGYGLDLHVPGTDWDAMETDVDRLVELWSMHGSSEGHDPGDRPLVGSRRPEGVMAGLRQGLRFGFVAGSDTHSGRPGGSAKEPRPYWGGLVAVWATELTRRGIFAALRARRTYALTGARIILRFTVNGAWMGSDSPPADHARIKLDAWAPGNITRVELMKNADVLHSFAPDADECHYEYLDETHGPAFYHCRVTRDDGELAVASPVWIG